MKEKKTQIIVNIITAINIIIIFVLTYYLFVNNKYSAKYIRKLLEKNYEYKNYILEIEQKDLERGELYKTRITQKEECRKVEDIINNSTRWYMDNLCIERDRNNDIRQYSGTETIITTIGDEMNCYRYISKDNDIDNNYKYLKKEVFNNINCIVVEFKNNARITNQGKSYYTSYRIWIDEEKRIYYKGRRIS